MLLRVKVDRLWGVLVAVNAGLGRFLVAIQASCCLSSNRLGFPSKWIWTLVSLPVLFVFGSSVFGHLLPERGSGRDWDHSGDMRRLGRAFEGKAAVWLGAAWWTLGSQQLRLWNSTVVGA